MTRFFAVLVPFIILAVQSPVQAQELERDALTGVMDTLDRVEQLWNDRNIQELTVMVAEPFSLITPDGVYRGTYFHPEVQKLLSSYFSGDAEGSLELKFSGLSMLNEGAAYLEATGAHSEKKFVITAVVRKFGDDWKASNIHISNLHEKTFVSDE